MAAGGGGGNSLSKNGGMREVTLDKFYDINLRDSFQNSLVKKKKS